MANPSFIEQRIFQAAMRLFAERGSRQISVSELAQAAGVARGTIYNHVGSLENLFENMVVHLTADMNQRVADSVATSNDPAERLALGIRLYIRRAHEEPDWGLFIMSFGFSTSQMHPLWAGQPIQDLYDGIAQGRLQIPREKIASALALLGSSVIAGMQLTRNGYRTWRDAGSDSAELMLLAFGLEQQEAAAIAHKPLPPTLEESQRLTG